MFKKLLNAFINTNEKEVKKLQPLVEQVNALEQKMRQLSDAELREKTKEFQQRYENGETLDALLPEAFAVVREAADRTIHMRHFDVQIMGGIVLHQGRIAEMKTGEGKTLVATLPVYLNAITKKGVHVVTVNDYLAKRDSEWMGKVYRFLGLSVGLIVPGLNSEERRKAYQADITFATNNELGFDYLRDNMAVYKEQLVMRKLNYAVVDEVDSILIDEARTPLIISGMGFASTEQYQQADTFVSKLKKDEDYSVDEKANTCFLTEEGTMKAEEYFHIESLFDPEHQQLAHHINNALKARNLMKRDKDYVVKDGAVIIVDQFTGRLMFGRQYSDGLHQAIEAKEHVKIKKETQTLATITFQNFFRMYEKLSGMTGTAMTEEKEFIDIYGMDVVEIPTNKPMQRIDQPDAIFKTEAGKFRYIVDEIKKSYETGQPVLVGTVSIEKSEELSALLKKQGVKHQVLNAKYHEKEAEIIAQAGRFKAVTIATNMAGRGTDIMLGGNPEFMAVKKLKEMGTPEPLLAEATGFSETDDEEIIKVRETYQSLYDTFKKETDAEREKILILGGLKVLGTERHESRRIDNQLRGRSGRQGDPGESRFFISLEDDLMRLFGSDNMGGLMGKMGMDENEPLEHSVLTKSIENAQKRVENKNYDIRKHVLEYDMVMNKQREIIYSQRNMVLEGQNVKDTIMQFLDEYIDEQVEAYTAESKFSEEWDMEGLNMALSSVFLPRESFHAPGNDLEKKDLKAYYKEVAHSIYAEKEKSFEAVPDVDFREVERILFLRAIDERWIDHIDAMQQLKQGIGLRAYGQTDPLQAYRNEGFQMFNDMVAEMKVNTLRMLFHVKVENRVKRSKVAEPVQSSVSDTTGSSVKKPVKKTVKVGRNDPCPCGSGLKYKKCCGKDE